MHYAVAEWLLLIWDHLFVIVVFAVGISESVSVGSIRRNSLLQKRPSPHSVTHIHTWREPSKTAVWSVGHSWALSAWLRSCFHSSPPRVILKPCDWTDNLWAAHIFFRPLFGTLDTKGRSNLLRLVGKKKHTPYILKFQIYINSIVCVISYGICKWVNDYGTNCTTGCNRRQAEAFISPRVKYNHVSILLSVHVCTDVASCNWMQSACMAILMTGFFHISQRFGYFHFLSVTFVTYARWILKRVGWVAYVVDCFKITLSASVA